MAFDTGFTWYMFSPDPSILQNTPLPGYLLAANNPAQSGQPDNPNDRVFETSNGLTSEGWITRSNTVNDPN
jgi:hypothetical protein